MHGPGSSRVAHPLAASAGALLALVLAGSAACASSGGNQGDGPPADPTITSFAAVPASVEPGGATSLVAVFANGTGEIDGGIGGVSSGVPASTDPLQATTTFTLTVRNTAGVRVTRAATVTVVAPVGPGTVTILRRATSGALEPVQGISIHRSAASTGAYVETRVTDATGRADFGDIGAARTTLSLVRPAANGTPKTVVSFVAVPVGAVTLRLDRLPGPREALAEVNVAFSPSSTGGTVQLPSGPQSLGAVQLAREDLQDDGTVTVLGHTGDGGEGGPLVCGASLDQPVPAGGATLPITLDGASSELRASADAAVPISLTLAALRKDAVFEFRTDWPRTSQTLASCVPTLPDVDLFSVAATTWAATVQTNEGYDVVETTFARRVAVVDAGPLPGAMTFTLPDLTPEALSYGGGAVQASATGTLAAAVDLAVARVETTDLAWHVYARRGDALALPDVPGATAPAWSPAVAVESELIAVDGVTGFDALWSQVRRLGSVEAALLANGGSAAATARMTRFTPNYSIVMDGYFWERYGTVTDNHGMNCGAACSSSWTAGETATLVATPNPGARFNGWGGDCAAWGTTSPVDVIVDRYLACNPSFGPASGASYSLTVAIAGGWSALITSDDGQIKCGDDTLLNHFSQCSLTGNSGYGLRLTATSASTTQVFDAAWIGDCAGTGWSTFVALNGNKSCSVELTPRPP